MINFRDVLALTARMITQNVAFERSMFTHSRSSSESGSHLDKKCIYVYMYNDLHRPQVRGRPGGRLTRPSSSRQSNRHWYDQAEVRRGNSRRLAHLFIAMYRMLGSFVDFIRLHLNICKLFKVRKRSRGFRGFAIVGMIKHTWCQTSRWRTPNSE